MLLPDLRVEMRSGRVVIERLIPPKGVSVRERRNIEFARDIYEGRGFEFRVLYASEVLGTVAEKNSREIAFDEIHRRDRRRSRPSPRRLRGAGRRSALRAGDRGAGRPCVSAEPCCTP